MVMAMATRSSRANPMDARVPCPACGQPIHPIAGRCKHCKTDLVKQRPRAAPVVLGGAPAAPSPAPAAPVVAARVPTPAPAPINGHNGVHVASHAAEAPRSSWSRRWPTIVVLLAGIAIAICAYLLLLDRPSEAAAPKRQRGVSPAPAPDRMDTMPNPGARVDPWGGAPTTPDPTPAPPAPVDPAPPSMPPPSAPPPSTTTPGVAPPPEEFTGRMLRSLCEVSTRCASSAGLGGLDCDILSSPTFADPQRDLIRAGKCTYDDQKAAACLATIDKIQCQPGQLDFDVFQSLGAIGDCMDALRCRP